MGKKLKKGEKGAVTNYVTRGQAIKKLQISLAHFRRLCILKGVYPREPRNKKKVGKGSTAARTYYYRKDIQYLLHEPVLHKLREQKVFARKLSKAIAKQEWTRAKSLEEQRPEYTLDHIIKERYPTFVDALRDLDDALSMIFLFATLPTTDKIKAEHVRTCQRLSAEFQHYIMVSHSLRKVFLSIKGIYYQAEIKGELITWIVPYQFSQHVPTDVDFRVMSTFLELYETLLGFVNFKLYRELNLVYPPKLDEERDSAAAGLTAYVLENAGGQDVVSEISAQIPQGGLVRADRSQRKQTAKRLESLAEKIAEINETEEADGEETTKDDEDVDVSDVPQAAVPATSQEETVPTLTAWQDKVSELTGLQKLFKGCVFWLSREVPRYSLEFVIRAFGGEVGWDASSGAGSPFAEDDTRITHHIIDRPPVATHTPAADGKPAAVGPKRYERREYLQPQWVYDSVNARKLVRTAGYHAGETLPPHLSPFANPGEGDYVPEEAMDVSSESDEEEVALAATGAGEDAMEVDEEEEEEEEELDEEEEADAEDDDEEALHQAELAAEAAGLSFSEYLQQKAAGTLPADGKKQKKKGADVKAAKKETAAEAEERERKELAIMMMSKKDKHLYNKIQFGKQRKADAVSSCCVTLGICAVHII
ncbi:Pescadillo N-terminus-domain-containing protein [Fimicolochytrium jonesii]|uniref:Pescadillo N-terminus-domain-containing protein n=1 Tax=Fimicolochytrium jonesii TaxID=1396493 RepID=UPI0022FDFD8B|nr:Pescadillo N-terminus-domain-containing protein [Fimicolochytrium jonesii]KAI8816476.1 Pescadillo N-terminus-domain-containing protein [Fimicolochytrium jonesii]